MVIKASIDATAVMREAKRVCPTHAKSLFALRTRFKFGSPFSDFPPGEQGSLAS